MLYDYATVLVVRLLVFVIILLKYGVNAEALYDKVIGCYQSKNMDNQAEFYYKDVLNNGLFFYLKQ